METSTIKFLPVCWKCKQIVWDKIEASASGEHLDISPARCPTCGSLFVNIEMPAGLPFDNGHN